ncbi:37S ribosomal protein S24, mitochondrial [Naganishia albida]|nr:37S ribosomal protein S24, mitochondrial [Naganishia albida]
MLSTTLQNTLRSTGKTALQRGRQATFSTTRAQAAQQREGRDASRRDADRNAFDITGIQKFQFDDTTSYGHMILEKKRERLELLRAIERDRSLLEQQRKPFQPPSKEQCLRFTTTIDLVTPADASPRETAHMHKSVVHFPISRLPLTDAAAIHRFKLLAGPRWIPPKSAVLQQDSAGQEQEAEHGWFKMSQDSFGDVRMNRQWLMDTVQRMIKEANSTTSPIAQQELPLDLRHVYARLRKKRDGKRGEHVWARVQARTASGNGGGVQGFPKEWL